MYIRKGEGKEKFEGKGLKGEGGGREGRRGRERGDGREWGVGEG